MQKLLIIFGAVMILIGLLWPWLAKLGLGLLPGDLVIEREGFAFYFPTTTMILISIVLTVVLRILGK